MPVKLKHYAVKPEPGRARFQRVDFHVLPRHSARPARPESLQRGFFGGESCGIMLCGDRTARVAVLALAWGEDAFAEARGALQDFTNATDFYNVYADGNNHGRT